MKQKDIDMSQKAEDDNQVDAAIDNDSNKSTDETKPPLDSELQNIIEAALYAAKEPLGIKKITGLFPEDAQPSKVDIQNVIITLQEQCEYRGVELKRIGKGWRFQTKEKYSPWLRKLSANKAPKYSRALLETLSIIAYRQPVTRGDIEEIRGVGVSSDTIRTLEERDWIAQIGHRDVPGRPALFGTTQGFLEYFNMASLRELPELIDKRELGEIAKDMNMTLPMDGVQDGDEAAKAKADADNQADEQEPQSAEIIELNAGANVESSEPSDDASLEKNAAETNNQADVETLEEQTSDGSDNADASEVSDAQESHSNEDDSNE